jgi:two-component system, NarL family, nitrate/nitrite response regulator NarL
MNDQSDLAARSMVATGHISTVIVDLSGLFREGLKRLLAGSPFRIEFEFASLSEAGRCIGQGCRPDLILSAFDGAVDSFEDLNQLRAACPAAKLVVLAGKLVPRFLAQSLEAGVDGYLLKDISLEALTQSLSLVMVGEKVFPTQLAGLLIQGTVRPDRPFSRAAARLNGLSDREEAILRCLVYGLSNKIIAGQLQMTEASVKVHLKALLRKIQVANRTQAAIWAINNGFRAELAGEGTLST